MSKDAKSEKTYGGDQDTLNSGSLTSDNTKIDDADLAPLAKEHPFQDPVVLKHWLSTYESVNYEGLSHFDPEFTWTKEEERKVTWRIEFRVVLWAFIMFVALDIDRYNITNATSGTFLKDLGLNTPEHPNDLDTGTVINYACFLAAELPSQLISKKIGPDVWIPMQLVLWSIVATCQAAIQNRTGFFITRCIVGALQGGFIPDVGLWMSYFYTTNEMSTRMGWFYVANPITQAASALLAYAIFQMHNAAGLAGWRWVFLIEGCVTFVVGVMAFFLMPASAVQTKAKWRPKGWFTERQEKILVNRILRDDPSKGDMNNREALTPKMLWMSLKDYDMWPIYGMRLIQDIIAMPISIYIALLLRRNFSTLDTNLLMVPPNILAAITLIISMYIVKWKGWYTHLQSVTAFWWIGPLAAMRWWKPFLDDKWGSYAVLLVALGAPTDYALTNAWCSANANSVRTRTVAAALVNMCSQAAAMIGSYVFRGDDAPKYPRGVQQMLALAITMTFVPYLSKFYYIARNQWKKRKWNAMSEIERDEYLAENGHKGNKRLDFYFVH